MDLNNKVIAGLSRVSEVFKVLLWQQAKKYKLSPIQVQILHFIDTHNDKLCTISYMAKEFNLTKPTISDAIRVLVDKKLLVKDFSSEDNRSYSLLLSAKGKEIVKLSEGFTDPIKNILGETNQGDLEIVFKTLSKLIFQLNRAGILTVQRMCFGCKFYNQQNGTHYCNLLEKKLVDSEIRLDCAEFELKA